MFSPLLLIQYKCSSQTLFEVYVEKHATYSATLRQANVAFQLPCLHCHCIFISSLVLQRRSLHILTSSSPAIFSRMLTTSSGIMDSNGDGMSMPVIYTINCSFSALAASHLCVQITSPVLLYSSVYISEMKKRLSMSVILVYNLLQL